MRALRLLAVLLLAATGGCLLTTGQVLVSYDLPSPIHVSGPNALVAVQVDLNSVSAYRDHKDGLEDLADLALLGAMTNNAMGDPIDIEVWMTRDATNLVDATQVQAQGIPLWGPQRVVRGETRRPSWDDSADNVTAEGRQALLEETKGDGVFTLYFLDRTSSYDFTVSEGVLVLVLAAGI